MIEHLLTLTCGWVGGVVSTLLIRHMLDGRRPLDPALLPTSVAVPIAALPALPPAPQLSPYAPKKVLPKPTQRTQLQRVWRAAKQDRPTSWVTNAAAEEGAAPSARAQAAPPPARSASNLLPSIAWGTNTAARG